MFHLSPNFNAPTTRRRQNALGSAAAALLCLAPIGAAQSATWLVEAPARWSPGALQR